MPGLFQKVSLCVVQSVSVCANELLKKKKAHSLLEAMLRLKLPKREGGKYPQMAEMVLMPQVLAFYVFQILCWFSVWV